MSEFQPVCAMDAIPPGAWECFKFGSESVVVFNLDGEFHAIDDTCPHRGGPLSKGFLEGCVMYCPLHGWPFDVRTGLMPGNSEIGVATFAVKVQDGQIWLAGLAPVTAEGGQA